MSGDPSTPSSGTGDRRPVPAPDRCRRRFDLDGGARRPTAETLGPRARNGAGPRPGRRAGGGVAGGRRARHGGRAGDRGRPPAGPGPRGAAGPRRAVHRGRIPGSSCANSAAAGGSTPGTGSRRWSSGSCSTVRRAGCPGPRWKRWPSSPTGSRSPGPGSPAVRGVNVDGVIRTLMSRGLIEESAPTRIPAACCTGPPICSWNGLGLSDLSELPSLGPLLPDIDGIDDV